MAGLAPLPRKPSRKSPLRAAILLSGVLALKSWYLWEESLLDRSDCLHIGTAEKDG